MVKQVFDQIVIGVGGMGSAAVYELARRGQRVLRLEQLGIPHELGPSAGSTRIFRFAYSRPRLRPLMRLPSRAAARKRFRRDALTITAASIWACDGRVVQAAKALSVPIT